MRGSCVLGPDFALDSIATAANRYAFFTSNCKRRQDVDARAHGSSEIARQVEDVQAGKNMPLAEQTSWPTTLFQRLSSNLK